MTTIKGAILVPGRRVSVGLNKLATGETVIAVAIDDPALDMRVYPITQLDAVRLKEALQRALDVVKARQ